MNSRCAYCQKKADTFDQAVRHCIVEHLNDEVSFIVETVQGQHVKFKKRTFHIRGKELLSDVDDVYYSHDTGKLVIPKAFNSPTKSPLHKKIKLKKTIPDPRQLFVETERTQRDSLNESGYCSSDIDKELNQVDNEFYDLTISTEVDEIASNINEVEGHTLMVEEEQLKQAVTHLQELLPMVTLHLQEHNRLNEWVTFFNLVDRGEFQVSHIASQLFFDVVKFASLGDAHGMRYSREVKEFWTVPAIHGRI